MKMLIIPFCTYFPCYLKGTIVHVHQLVQTENGVTLNILHEFRRGINPAKIYWLLF
jgi:hypothetical protein